jgi:hypothetical protein
MSKKNKKKKCGQGASLSLSPLFACCFYSIFDLRLSNFRLRKKENPRSFFEMARDLIVQSLRLNPENASAYSMKADLLIPAARMEAHRR